MGIPSSPNNPSATFSPPKKWRPGYGRYHHNSVAPSSSAGATVSAAPATSSASFELSQHYELRQASDPDLKHENCPICLFGLADSGMYDDDSDDDDDGVDSSRQVSALKECKHMFHPRCLAEMSKKNSAFFQVNPQAEFR